jgi:Protein of unknown function (DUF3102)
MPTSAPVTSNFDYTALDIDTASFVRQQTGEIRALMRRATQDIFEIGQKLIDIKQKLGHGNFLDWLGAEFSWTERTARRFMSVAEQFADKSDTMTDLDFAPTALYTLAAPSISSEAREEAIERAKAGEFISAKKAEEIKQKYPSKTAKSKKTSKETETPPTVKTSVEIIDAELESPPPQLPSQNPKSEAIPDVQVPEPDEVKALPPSPHKQWWRLSGKEQTHLLFCGQSEDAEFLARLPEQVGIWMGFPPTPDVWQSPPNRKVETAFSYSTRYKGVNLNAIRSLIEGLIPEISSEDDETAAIAYLPDAPLLFLFDDFGLDCYIAEPDVAQCQVIIKAWKDLDGQVEKLENLEELD